MTYSSTILADSPIDYWRFNETSGTTAADSGSGANAATHNASVTVGASGRDGAGASYNGTTSSTSAASVADFMAGSAFSVELWVKYSTVNGDYSNFIRRDGAGRAWLIRTRNTTVGRAYIIECYHQGMTLDTGTVTFNDNNWHHVVYTWDGTTPKLYVDGTAYTTSKTGTVGAGGTGTTPVYIGTANGTSDYFNGSIDEVAIYNTALTSTKISAHFAAAGSSTQTPPPMTLSLSTPNAAPAHVVLPPAMTMSLSSVTPLVYESYVISTANTDGSSSSGVYVGCGVTGLTNAYDVVQMPTPALPTGGNTVQNATLYFQLQQYSLNATDTMYLGNVASYATGANWVGTPISYTATYPMTTGVWYSVDVTSLVNSWVNGTATNNGIGISRKGDPTSGSYRPTGYADAAHTFRMAVTYSPPSPNVTVTAPVANLSLASVTPVVSSGATEVIPAIALSLDTVAPAVSGISNITASVPALTMTLAAPGGIAVTPDTVSSAPVMNAGLSAVAPSIYAEFPAIVSAPPLVLSLDTVPATINLATNILKVAPVMTMSVNMVGIFDENHDRYFTVLPPTLGPEDIWYKLNETTGSTAVDSSVDTVNGGAWNQGGTYYGAFASVLDGPQLRKGVHFDGTTSFLKVGPYTTRDPEPDITTEMSLTVEFSIRTTQTDGVVYIGTGYHYYPANANGPQINGNEVRLEAGQLVLADAFGHKVRVRKFISDGQWHHIVVAIPQFISGGGIQVDPTQPSYVMVDGDHALVRYGTFLGGTMGYGGLWLPFTVMARATTLTGTFAPNGFLAGDLSNFVVRLNKYIPEAQAESIYYEWSDANIIHPDPITVSLSTVAPKVKGSVKKMLALYGLPFAMSHGAPAVGGQGTPLYEYLDVLSGMIIQTLGGNCNLTTTTAGRVWSPPTSFMVDDYFVVPVSILGNLTDNVSVPMSTTGTVNPDAPVTPDGVFVDDETGHPRFINLQSDLTVNVVDEYDVITVVNYPWERPRDTSVGEYNYITPFHGFGNMTDDQWQAARDGLRDSLMEAAYDGANMWIGDYYAAQHLGFIQGYDIHDFGRFGQTVTNNLQAKQIDEAHLSVPSGATGYYSYPQANFYRRITALVPGLTDLPGNDWGDWVEGWNSDEFKPNGNFVAYDITRRPNGLQLNDRITMPKLWMGSQKFGQNSGSITNLSFADSRTAITSAHPDGIAGTVVSREQDTYYGPGGVVVQNPYKDNALTIAAERGTIVRGRPIGGRVFIELMGTSWGGATVAEDADKALWGGEHLTGLTAQPSTWDYDSRRGKEIKATINTSALGIGADGSMTLTNKTTYYFQYQDGKYIQNLTLPMAYRGLKWIASTPSISAGDATGYASAITLSLSTPAATLDSTSSPATQVIGAMRLNLALRQPANYADGNIEVDIFGGMEMSVDMAGLGRTVAIPPMSLTVTTVDPTLKVDADTVIVYLDEGRNITLFLKEDN